MSAVQHIHVMTSPKSYANNIMATIASNSYGYYMGANNMGNHPEYIHNGSVDGSTKYGGCWYCFPMRSMVGGEYTANTASGSRCIAAYGNTTYTHYLYSQILC